MFRNPIGRAPAVWALALAAIGLALSAVEAAYGQEASAPATAVVRGRVVGPDRQPIAGVEVTLVGASGAVARSTSAESGEFRVEGVPVPGAYRVVCAVGTITEQGPEVTVSGPGEMAAGDVTLRLRVSEEVSVTADSWTLPPDLPNTVAIRTVEGLREQNMVNPEDALKYVPNTTIRKRYIGDRNALMGGRSFGTLQPSRALVFLDGYLLSNFLGRFDAPRWNMVTPQALERVDVMYGPFSAIHAGNSIGTTVVMTERFPQALEWGLSLTGHGQNFDLYGDEETFGGGQVSGYLGARHRSGLWGALTYNHQDVVGQPMQYFNVVANAEGDFPAVSGPATEVSGIQYDLDPKALRRAVFGGNAGAVDHTRQDSLKMRVGYAIVPELEISGIAAGWINDTSNSDRTLLHDAAGNEVWQGRVTDGVNTFNIPAVAFAPSTRHEKHLQLGGTLRTRRPSGWNGSAIFSDYRILEDPARQANNPDPVADDGGPGTVTRRDGTGWQTFEVQATYTPVPGGFLGGGHALTFGGHRNAYTLDNAVRDAPDWRYTETTLAQRFQGRTRVLAFYAQDAWTLTEDLKLTLGWRAEWFRTFDGEQLVRVGACTPASGVVCVPNGDGTFDKTVPYGERELQGQSPKASLAWTVNSRVTLRGSYGHGVRFPNVEELYNGTVTATSVNLSDPNLRSERADAFDLTAEMVFGRQTVRASLFHDDVYDAIMRQSDQTVTPTITNVSNVDHVRTSGIEVAWAAQDVGVKGLSVEANAAFARSKVLENAKDPAQEGKYFLRVPKTRGTLLVAYRPTEKWMASAGYRHSGAAYNDVYNLDVNRNTYGGLSTLNQIDLKVSYKPATHVEAAVGVDNITDQRAYQSHPFPGRTLVVELRTSSR
jgi:iron complex outermembrane receptor protein